MKARTVMVLGATGFIGPAVVRRLLARGHEAVAVSRSGGAVAGATSWRLDRNHSEEVLAAVRRVQPDAVIDLLAYTERETRPIIEGLAGRTGRYVMASSGDVYRQYDLLHRKAGGVAVATLDEAAPLRDRPFPYRGEAPRAADDPQSWMDDYDKIPVERAVAGLRGLNWSILRLPMVFGPGDRQRRFAWAIGPMLGGAPSLSVDALWAGWRTSLGYVEDVAEALALAAHHPGADGRTFNVGPAEAVSNLDWARAFAGPLGWRGAVETTPREATPEPTRSRLEALDLTVPLLLDSGLIRRDLGYAEVTGAEAALLATIEDERGRR